MDWNDKTVAVTGAGGFIGGHLVEALAARGAHVRALVRYTSRADHGTLRLLSPEALARVQVLQGDLRSYDSVRRAIEGATVVFHLGAAISIPYSYVSPDEVTGTNVGGTLNVLEACRTLGIARLVHTSTSEVFGTARYVPIDEKHPLQAQSPYSATKIGADKLVESFRRSFTVPSVTVRPFNTYGPRQSARAVIPSVITQLLRGDELRMGHLHPTRDFVFVTDTVAAFLLAGSVEGATGLELNVATGREISIRDLVNLLGRLLGRQVEIATEAERLRPKDSEVERLCGDATLARQVLGWSPQVELEEGLRRTADWIRANEGYYLQQSYQR